MNDLWSALSLAVSLIWSLDAGLFEIVSLSLRVSLTAVAISCLIGMPLGAFLAVSRFPGRSVCVVLINSLLGLPPVVAGLLVYILLSQAGPLAVLELLYTPSAMIIAQTLLVVPIIASLTLAVVGSLAQEYRDLLTSMKATRWDSLTTLLWDARFDLVVAALAGFGRALAEVGAVMIVGGNINHFTRVMTSAITLNTARGEFALALALGLVLLALAIVINAAIFALKGRLEQSVYAS